MKKYQSRPIRFIERFSVDGWTIKLYSISDQHEFVGRHYIDSAKKETSAWLGKKNLTSLETYQIANLILHECKEGCFAIVNWWIDENMLQHFVYLRKNQENRFEEYSSENGISTCVWELSVLWFERNAWIQYVLSQEVPDFEGYLNAYFNQD